MSQLDAPILIMGETGTGKELLARACHAASSRSGKPFLALNCASLPDNVAESELFGYGANAFPGTTEGKKGIFEQANGGTVFLDEVGEMSHSLQTKLIRFLQTLKYLLFPEQRFQKMYQPDSIMNLELHLWYPETIPKSYLRPNFSILYTEPLNPLIVYLHN